MTANILAPSQIELRFINKVITLHINKVNSKQKKKNKQIRTHLNKCTYIYRVQRIFEQFTDTIYIYIYKHAEAGNSVRRSTPNDNNDVQDDNVLWLEDDKRPLIMINTT